jgi:hypothetical protein
VSRCARPSARCTHTHTQRTHVVLLHAKLRRGLVHDCAALEVCCHLGLDSGHLLVARLSVGAVQQGG